ncbi:unnamed protein product [Calypogeia fissa]
MTTTSRLEPIVVSWVHATSFPNFLASLVRSSWSSCTDFNSRSCSNSRERQSETRKVGNRLASAMSGEDDSKGEGSVKVHRILNQHPLGVGTWSWGQKKWGSKGEESEQQFQEAFLKSIDCGIHLFDTAPVYGNGKSETLIGKFLKQIPVATKENLVIATKYIPLPFHFNCRKQMTTSLHQSLSCLQLEQVDLFQIHGPALSIRSIEHLADGLADAYDAGLCKAVGVSNFSADEIRRAHSTLLKRNVPLQSNQVEFSLLRLLPETNGLLSTCSELGVSVLAYSPLAMGRLTGKYSVANPPPSDRIFGNFPMEEIEPLVTKLKEIGEAHNKTPSQVALNWILRKGAIPIPGAKNAKQAEENAGALGWSLTSEEVDELSRLGKTGKTTKVWQHG